jgi:hypothetical protein
LIFLDFFLILRPKKSKNQPIETKNEQKNSDSIAKIHRLERFLCLVRPENSLWRSKTAQNGRNGAKMGENGAKMSEIGAKMGANGRKMGQNAKNKRGFAEILHLAIIFILVGWTFFGWTANFIGRFQDFFFFWRF